MTWIVVSRPMKGTQGGEPNISSQFSLTTLSPDLGASETGQKRLNSDPFRPKELELELAFNGGEVVDPMSYVVGIGAGISLYGGAILCGSVGGCLSSSSSSSSCRRRFREEDHLLSQDRHLLKILLPVPSLTPPVADRNLGFSIEIFLISVAKPWLRSIHQSYTINQKPGYCRRAKAVFKELNQKPFVVELDQREDGSIIQAAMGERVKRHTVPQVFIDGKHIGGSDDTVDAYESGELATLLGIEVDYDEEDL
ncbi:hypothetical protein CRG98_024531 [Punica granatum]|uniref:Glutaredoxin domain-containing protein n=1 Tax=Punica granatum TaxID=22663 RepID=A0A2I0JFL9_PUNGR|nr:hypothetical protein CRG98_024531 [Punica granatum]